jgi:hypothetical protein
MIWNVIKICCEHIGNLGTCKNPSENLMIWYEIEVLLGMACKTFWKPLGNLIGIPWELDGNIFATDKKTKKIPSPTPKNPKEKKGAHWAFSLAASNICFHKEEILLVCSFFQGVWFLNNNKIVHLCTGPLEVGAHTGLNPLLIISN